jgi:hypothetical protein
VLRHFYRKVQRKNHLMNIQRWQTFYLSPLPLGTST